ncbi:MAG: alpha/beta fold hydrolase [Acidimicrobiia bacterium]|nr:alpha/beta fold hydrolase [Acidimicrobiia bacterium]
MSTEPTASPTGDRTLVYLPGLAGDPGSSPALAALEAEGWTVVRPLLPGFDGEAGFDCPDDYLGWLTALWDAVDATGVGPCPVVGASVGGMLAADLAVFRPELVTRLALLAPFGIFDPDHPGLDPYSVPTAKRLEPLFAEAVPEAFHHRFAAKGESEAPVARYLTDIAAASLIWPVGDQGLEGRLHRIRCPRLVLWGTDDQIIPAPTAASWGDHRLVDGAGHLLEWDRPDAVAALLLPFLSS